MSRRQEVTYVYGTRGQIDLSKLRLVSLSDRPRPIIGGTKIFNMIHDLTYTDFKLITQIGQYT